MLVGTQKPMHKMATRAMKLWKEYNSALFKLPCEKRAAWLTERRAEVIQWLNADFAKPWFRCKEDGRVVQDIGNMTYQTALRLVRLRYLAHEARWVDLSLRNVAGDWLRRVGERFTGVNGNGPKASTLQSFSSLDKPDAFVQEFFKAYPLAMEQLLASEDKAYFLTIAQRPGQKSVPFTPILDATFEVWFKRDSLWAAEDNEAVFDEDPQRVCTLQGPVAVKRSKVRDQPIKDMLDKITSILADKLLQRLYGGDESKVPVIDYLGAKPADIPPVPGVQIAQQGSDVALSILSAVPDKAAWLHSPAGAEPNWWQALLSSVKIVQGHPYVDNPLRRLFAPRKGQNLKVVLTLDGSVPAKVTVFGAARSHGAHNGQLRAVEFTYDAASRAIDVTIFEDRRDVSVPLILKFQHEPSQSYAPIYEVTEGRNDRIKDFYWRLWFGDNEVTPQLDVRETFYGPEFTATAADVETFCGAVGNQQEVFKTTRSDDVQAPMDFATITGWQAIVKTIFPASIDGDLLKLVHLSNSFKILPGLRSLRAGDLKHPVKTGTVEFERDDCQGNPIVAYLQHNGAPQGKPVPLANDGYALTNLKSDAAVFTSPLTNELYSKISGDFNPIHVHPLFSDYASLPGTIAHGMWSSAGTRRYVETVVAQGHSERVHKYSVSFVGLVLPAEELSVKIKHTCVQGGNMAVKVETFNSRGEKVLEGTAEVSQPATVYVFTGRGSQEPGMGIHNSPATRTVDRRRPQSWDIAFSHHPMTSAHALIVFMCWLSPKHAFFDANKQLICEVKHKVLAHLHVYLHWAEHSTMRMQMSHAEETQRIAACEPVCVQVARRRAPCRPRSTRASSCRAEYRRAEVCRTHKLERRRELGAGAVVHQAARPPCQGSTVQNFQEYYRFLRRSNNCATYP